MSQPILNLDELKTLEERMTHALGEGELMRRAGSVLAEEIASVTPPSGHVVFICGPGNNSCPRSSCARVSRHLCPYRMRQTQDTRCP